MTSLAVVICGFTVVRAHRLADAVASVQAQTQTPAETIVVCDHSDDLAAWARRHLTGVTIVESDQPAGLSGARNAGVAAARAELVAFLDDDAVAAPDWAERLMAACEAPDVVGVGGRIDPDWEGGRPRWMPREFDWVVGCSYRGLPERGGPVRNVIGCNMALRREAIIAAGGFACDLGRVGSRPLGCEETDLCIRICRQRPQSLLLYRPGAVVRHAVPRARATPRYFLSRCFGEGLSKAAVARRGGALATERAYVARTLPAGFVAAIGERAYLRAMAIAGGLAATASGYAVGTARR